MSEDKDTKNESNSDIKKKTGFVTNRPMRYAVATAVVLVSLLILSLTFVYRVYLMTESSCFDDLAVETENAITEFESNLRSDRMTLRVLAGLMGNAGDLDSLEVSGYLSYYEINSMVTRIGVLLPENTIISSKGRRSNDDNSMDFKQISLQGEHISGSQSNRSSSNSAMIRSYVPIRKDGLCIGMLYSEASASSIAKAWLPEVYNKKGYCYIVNRKTGKVLINTSSDQITDIHDISFLQTDPDYSKESTINAILNGKKGYSVFESEAASEKLYMCFLPFSIEDWEMVVFVPESEAFSAVAPIRNGMYFLMVASALLILIYIAWLFREVRASIAEAEQRANIDVLTDLPNRNRYESYLKKLEGSKERMFCLFIDANGLHELNNSKGHFAGDQMLRFIADTLKIQFGGDHIYRIGGDEFVVFLSGKAEDEINKSLASFNDILQRNDYHAAVGICIYENGISVNELIANAEKKMYESKKQYYEQTGKTIRV